MFFFCAVNARRKLQLVLQALGTKKREGSMQMAIDIDIDFMSDL